MPITTNYNPTTSERGGTQAVSGGASGPWMEEGQEFTITYMRVPFYQFSAAPMSMHSNIEYSYNPFATRVVFFVTASYYKAKTYNPFDTSGFTQTQKLEINNLSSDYLGNTYGDLTTLSALGPQGTVITSRPWYHRRYWDESVDVETSASIVGYPYTLGRVGCNTTSSNEWDYEYGENANNHGLGTYEQHLLNPANAGGLHDPNEWFPLNVDWFYNFAGGYAASLETLFKSITFIVNVGTAIRLEKLWQPDPPLSSNGQPDILQKHGIPEWDNNRIDFSL